MKRRVFCSLLGMRRRKTVSSILASALSFALFASTVMTSSLLPGTAVAVTDTTPPSAPSNLTIERTGNALKLAWSAASDDIGVASYTIERSRYGDIGWQFGLGFGYEQVATTFDLTYLNNLQKNEENIEYTYRVFANDAAGNRSSGYATATGIVDTDPPTVPASFSVIRSGNTLNLSWDRSRDNVGVDYYQVERKPAGSDWSAVGTTTASGWSDNPPEIDTRYMYRVRAFDAAGNFSGCEKEVEAAIDNESPAAPGSFVVSHADGEASLSLSWSPSSDNVGVAGYYVERSLDQVQWNELSSVESTGCSDEIAPAGQNKLYFYRVKALDFGGNYSDWAYSDKAGAFMPDVAPPEVPSWGDPEVSDVPGIARVGEDLKLTWYSGDNVGVSNYEVWRSLDGSLDNTETTSWSQIATLDATSTVATFTDTDHLTNTMLYYKLRARDAAGNVSDYTYWGDAAVDKAPPSVPLDVKVSRVSGKNQLTVSWSESTDTGGNVAGYYVEKSPNGTNGWVPAAPTTQMSMTYSPTTDVRYYFRVRAFDDAAPANLSGYSSVVDGMVDTKAPTVPAAPKAVATSVSTINLSWTASTDAGGSGIAGYNVQRSTDQKTWTSLKDAPKESFADTKLEANKIYYYRVRAYDMQGKSSVWSPTFSAKTWMRISREENAPYLNWKGTWTTGKNSAYSGGSTKYTSTKDNAVSITFRGGSIYWMGAKTASRGKANVYIDGKLVETVDQYAKTTATNQTIFPKAGLSNAVHTLKIVALGGGITEVDRIMIDGACPGVNFEQTAAKTGGSWSTKTGGSYSNSSAVASSSTNAYSEFSFTGTSVTWIGTKAKDRGIAKVYVDGTLKGSIDQYAAATAYQQALYTVNGLANKAHKIKIVVTGTKRTTSAGKTVDVDAFVVR